MSRTCVPTNFELHLNRINSRDMGMLNVDPSNQQIWLANAGGLGGFAGVDSQAANDSDAATVFAWTADPKRVVGDMLFIEACKTRRIKLYRVIDDISGFKAISNKDLQEHTRHTICRCVSVPETFFLSDSSDEDDDVRSLPPPPPRARSPRRAIALTCVLAAHRHRHTTPRAGHTATALTSMLDEVARVHTRLLHFFVK